MCWEDIKIGQNETYVVRSVLVDNVAPTVIARGAVQRSVLIITTPSADAIRCLPGTDPTPTFGLLVDAAAAGEKTLSLQHYGRMVQDEWRAVATGAAPVTVAIIEVTLASLLNPVGSNADGRAAYRPH